MIRVDGPTETLPALQTEDDPKVIPFPDPVPLPVVEGDQERSATTEASPLFVVLSGHLFWGRWFEASSMDEAKERVEALRRFDPGTKTAVYVRIDQSV